MSRVVVRMGNVLEGAADLTVFPASAKGTVSSWTRSIVQLHGIPLPKPSKLGTISEPIPYPGDQIITKYVVYAASVLNDYSTADDIRRIGAALGTLAQRLSDLTVIEAPLLGTGAGGLMTEVSAEALVAGFTSTAPARALLYICVADRERFDRIAKLLQEQNALPNPEKGDTDLTTTANGEDRTARLSGRQKQELCAALEDAFTYFALQQMVSFYLEVELEGITWGGNLKKSVYDLVIWAEKAGQVRALINGARQANPTNPKLIDFEASFHA